MRREAARTDPVIRRIRHRLRHRFVAEPQAAAAARRACAAVAAELPGELGRRFELLVTELVTNALRHGSARATDVVSLDVRVSDAVLHAQVRDAGPGFEPPAPPQRGRLSQRGWGLVLVDALADRWGATREVGRVWFELDLRPIRPGTGEPTVSAR
jgi:anti-sigma regulatory factor (Ser/Thr protein kinase)